MSGALLLALVSVICVADCIIALRFRTLADQADTAVGVAKPKLDPANARRVAGIMLVMAPLMWLFIALLAFGIFPNSGIIPIKF